MRNSRWPRFWTLGITVFLFFFIGYAKADEQSVPELVSQGNDFYLKGEFRKAIEVYQEALLPEMKDLTKAKIHYNLGNSHYRLGELEKALKEYQEALRLNPGDSDSKFNLEVVLRALQGGKGVLKEKPSEVQRGPQQESLDKEVRFILQQLEREEVRDPKGLPVPPSGEEKPKIYKKDW